MGVLMIATQDHVVTIRYVLRVEGEIIDQGELPYLHGYGNIIPGLEEALEGKKVGDSLQVSVPPEKAYGLEDPEGVRVIPRDQFPPDAPLEPGVQLFAQDENGQVLPFWIMEVEGDEVTIDFNHPLAGETLNFDVTISSIRAATQEELEHGHVHAPEGHMH
jgi:FKBP-type peptidyl-prolyl cis-trans isomerase SlyD